MKDFLTRVGVAVRHEPVAAFFYSEQSGDLGYSGEDFTHDDAVVAMNVVEGRDVLPGYDENMLGGCRMNILESDTEVIFVNSFGRDFAIDDFTEKTLGHEYHLHSSGVSRSTRVRQFLLLALLVVLSIPACASVTQPKSSNLREVVKRFHHNLRWKYNEDAAVRVVPKYSADFRDRLEDLKKDLSITSWKTRKVELIDNGKIANVKVYLKFFLMPSTVVRDVKLDELWELVNGGWFISGIKGGPFAFPSDEKKSSVTNQYNDAPGRSKSPDGVVREIPDDDPDG